MRTRLKDIGPFAAPIVRLPGGALALHLGPDPNGDHRLFKGPNRETTASENLIVEVLFSAERAYDELFWRLAREEEEARSS
jgi:hypothetical protein